MGSKPNPLSKKRAVKMHEEIRTRLEDLVGELREKEIRHPNTVVIMGVSLLHGVRPERIKYTMSWKQLAGRYLENTAND